VSIYKVLADFNLPATAQEVYDRALDRFPSVRPKNVQAVRAGLAYLVRTGKATRTRHGRYEAVRTEEHEIRQLVAENNRLREKLNMISRIVMVAFQANGMIPQDIEEKANAS